MLAHMPRAVETADAEDQLRRIEAVTDTELAHLSVEELLQELLTRVRGVLDVDTATVLLLDAGGQELHATASSGIEEEVRQGVRVPVGEGFAGRVAAEHKPLILEHIDPVTVVNPLLWDKGLVSLAGVPLLAENELIGVLHVGTLRARTFTDEDVRLLRLVADRIALAVRTRISQTERAAASTLQRSLLPGCLPQIPGLEFCSRYVPGEDVGVSGDWYDAFTLPSGWLCVAIGDVVGRGLPAATVMSRMRTATRSYALDATDPADVLTRLDRHMRHFEPGAMATIAYAMWEPSLERMHLSLAGHLAPVLALPGEDAMSPEVPVDPPIGAGFPTYHRRTTTLEIPYGTTVFFYTDGLVERRDRPLEEGLDLLRKHVRPGPAEATCARVLSGLVGSRPATDDIAVLTLRRQDLHNLPSMDLELEAVPESLGELRASLRRWLPTVGASEDDEADLLVAVGEAAANVIEHAYGPGGGKYTVCLRYSDGELHVTVSDNGRWRSPRGEHRGRGTDLMRQLCDEVSVLHHDGAGTDVRLCKRLAGDGPG